MKKIIIILILINLLSVYLSSIHSVKAVDFSATKMTDTSFNKYIPQMQVIGSKIHYVWKEIDSSNKGQIWTASMNTNGTGWSATQRTSSNYYKDNPQLQVVDNKVYYVWQELDASSKWQIWIASMDTDGNNWSATKKTDTTYWKDAPQMQVVGSKIYYVWYEYDGSYDQIWTASMDTDGNNWSATKRTTSSYDKDYPQMQEVGSKIYYVWQEYDDNSYYQIWTASMDTDGNNWSATKRTTSEYDKQYAQMQVESNKIYYVWYETDDDSYWQVWTASMDTDGNNWSATKRTTNLNYKIEYPQLQLNGSELYYVWSEYDNSNNAQIWTATMNTDGSEWSATKKTNTSYYKETPQFNIITSSLYFVWSESDSSDIGQIWTAYEEIFNPSPSAEVNVSGTVDPAISFIISSDTLALGNMNSSSISKSNTITLTTITNASNGYSTIVKDAGNGVDSAGLFSSIVNTLIPTSTATLSAGTEGYGLSASSDTENVDVTYDKVSPSVGALSREYQTLVTNTGPVDSGVTNVDVSASVSGITKASNDYTDILTFVCTGNF